MFATEGPNGGRSIEVKRFMEIDHREQSQRMVLDWKNMEVVPSTVAQRMDSASTDLIVQKREKSLSPGEKVRCPFCGGVFPLPEDGLCPVCRRPIVIPETSETQVEVVWKHRDETPEEVLERSQKLLKQLNTPCDTPLTVGDLSIISRQKRSDEAVRRELRAMEQGMSIGDLSVVTAGKDSVQGQLQAKQAQEAGLTVGSLFVGAPSIEPAASESQLLQAKMLAQHYKKQEQIFRLKNPSLLEGEKDRRLEST
jgi:hypothetical protein